MITLYKEKDGKLSSIQQCDGIIDMMEPNMWINVTVPNMDELTKIAAKTSIPMDMLLPALDEEESARVEVDDDSGCTLIILDTPCIESEGEDKENFSTVPFFVVYNETYFITMCSEKTTLITTVLAKTKRVEPHKHVRFALQLLFGVSSSYINCLKKIDMQNKRVEKVLHNSMKNKELFALMDLNKTLVYFSTSLNSNKIVLSKLARRSEYKKYEEDFDLMEDVLIENNQAIEMCSIYREISSGMTDAFASIISNNLNIVMKALTVITIVLSIPTVIASFFGMNFTNIPLSGHPNGFYITIGASAVVSLIAGIILYIYSTKQKR